MLSKEKYITKKIGDVQEKDMTFDRGIQHSETTIVICHMNKCNVAFYFYTMKWMNDIYIYSSILKFYLAPGIVTGFSGETILYTDGISYAIHVWYFCT